MPHRLTMRNAAAEELLFKRREVGHRPGGGWKIRSETNQAVLADVLLKNEPLLLVVPDADGELRAYWALMNTAANEKPQAPDHRTGPL